jgi:cholesterol transport system auxiliary component
MADSRGRRLEDRRQRAEDRGPRLEAGGRRLEDGGQRAGGGIGRAAVSVLRLPAGVLGILVLSAGVLGGCAQNAPSRQYYLLTAQPPAPTAPAEAGRGVLLVEPLRVAAAFAGRQLVYRVNEYRYETDYYHQYLMPPEQMLSGQTQAWLAASGLFRQVVTPGSPLTPTWALVGSVPALYGDFAGPGTPTAVLEIRFSLLGPADGNEATVFTQTYRAASPVPERTADAVVAALSQDLTQILTQLEADLRQRLAETARP